MIKVNGKDYEAVPCPPDPSCKNCAFDSGFGCHEAREQVDCCPMTGTWYIFKEVKEDGTGT